MAAGNALGRVWWLVLLNGIAKAVLGLLLMTNPGATVAVLVQFLGAYWLVSGIFAIVGIFVGESKGGSVWNLIVGLIGVLVGLAVLNHPILSAIITAGAIVTWIAVLALVMGVIRIIQAFQGDGWGIGLSGVVTVLFGLLLLRNPLGGAAALALVLGFFGLVGGVVMIFVAFRIRGFAAR